MDARTAEGFHYVSQLENTKPLRNYLLSRFKGSLAVTDQRIVGYAYQKRQVNVEYSDARIQQMTFTAETDKNNYENLKIQLDAGLFQPDWSGTIEYRFQTEAAQNLVTRIQGNIEKESNKSNVGQ